MRIVRSQTDERLAHLGGGGDEAGIAFAAFLASKYKSHNSHGSLRAYAPTLIGHVHTAPRSRRREGVPARVALPHNDPHRELYVDLRALHRFAPFLALRRWYWMVF
jgi:hypothetical protein